MTAYGTVDYYRERLAGYRPPDRWIAAVGNIEAVVIDDQDSSDAERLERVRAVLAALDEVRAAERAVSAS